MKRKIAVMVPLHSHQITMLEFERLPGSSCCTSEQLKKWSFDDSLFVGAYDNEAPMLAAHVREGVARALADEAFLILSGGRTRKPLVGLLTEADASRIWAARHAHLPTAYPFLRCERWARSSEENLCLSVALLCDEFAGRLADLRLTVIGWEFKRRRFEIQAQALRAWSLSRGLKLPPDWFDYVGVNNPTVIPENEATLVARLKGDPFLLSEQGKRESRDIFQPGEPPYRALGRWVPDIDSLSRGFTSP